MSVRKSNKQTLKSDEVQDKLAMRVLDMYKIAKKSKSNTNVMGRSIVNWCARLDRAYHKIHEADELEDRQNMNTYFGLIHSKVNMTQSFVKSKYISSSKYPFSLSPSPVVELPKIQNDKGFGMVVEMLVNVLMQNGMSVDAIIGSDGLIRPQIKKWIEEHAKEAKKLLRDNELKFAKEAADEMTLIIQDELEHGNFEEAFSDFIGDIILYPFAVIAFDFSVRTDNVWNGSRFEKRKVVKPSFRCVNPKNAFPSPDFSNNSKGYFVELLYRSKHELAGFLNNENFNYINDGLIYVLENGSAGWLEGNNEHKSLINDYDLIEVLKCQTMLSGEDLLNYGVSIEELGGESEEDVKFKYYDADIEVCANKVIMAQVTQTPNGRKSYFLTSYKKTSGKIYGISPAMMIYDRQLSINRTHYSMALNAYYSAGPMIELNAGAFDDVNDVQFLPYSIAYTQAEKNRSGGGVALHQISPTFHILFNHMVNEIRLADDECGLPSFLNGNAGLQGAGRTLGGLSIMQDNAIQGLKECFSNIDMYVIKPIIELMRDAILEESNKFNIYGDCDVSATGLLGLEREIEKTKIMAGLMPSIVQFAQQGVVPSELYQDYVMDFLQSNGVDTSKYINSKVATEMMGNNAGVDTQSQIEKLDARSLSHM